MPDKLSITEATQRWQVLQSHLNDLIKDKEEAHEIFINLAKNLVTLMNELQKSKLAHADNDISVLEAKISDIKNEMKKWKETTAVFINDIESIKQVMTLVACEDFQMLAVYLPDNTRVYIEDGTGTDATFTFEERKPVFRAMGNTYKSPTALYEAFCGENNLSLLTHWQHIHIYSPHTEHHGMRLSDFYNSMC
jgi:hypothetical protein